ncbi:MAG: alpha/beta hydrolase [Pigmentiphaga sp.]
MTAQPTPRVFCDPADAEAQYNLRVAFPDLPEVLVTWQEATDRVNTARQPVRDIAYGSDPLQNYDYFASGRPDAPLFVFVHGGYWQGGDKGGVGFVVDPYVATGADAAVLNYRLAPANRIEEMVDDVLEALRHLMARREAGELTFNPAKLVLMGHSAGGHLVATVACRAEAAGLPAPALVLPVSGLFDLPPLLPSSINHALGLDQTRAEALSPLLMSPPAGTEFQTVIGEHETAQFHEQARVLAEAWPQVSRHHVIADTHHFTVLNLLADPEQPAVRAMIDRMLALRG